MLTTQFPIAFPLRAAASGTSNFPIDVVYRESPRNEVEGIPRTCSEFIEPYPAGPRPFLTSTKAQGESTNHPNRSENSLASLVRSVTEYARPLPLAHSDQIPHARNISRFLGGTTLKACRR